MSTDDLKEVFAIAREERDISTAKWVERLRALADSWDKTAKLMEKRAEGREFSIGKADGLDDCAIALRAVIADVCGEKS